MSKPGRRPGKMKMTIIRENSILTYLVENGPTPERVLVEKIGPVNWSEYHRRNIDKLERFRFSLGHSRGKYISCEIYGGLSVSRMGPVLSLRNDPRLVDFIAKYVPLKIETSFDAAAMTQHFKDKIGSDRTRQLIGKLGYKYGWDEVLGKMNKITIKDPGRYRLYWNGLPSRDEFDFEIGDEISFEKLEDEKLWKPEDLIDLTKEGKKRVEPLLMSERSEMNEPKFD